MPVLNSIVSLALRFRGIVLALTCLLMAYGLYSLTRAHYDVFPEFAPPQVSIDTEAPGLSPEQVEQLVTQPLENAVNGVPGIESMRSDSVQGVSVITVNFDPKADIYLDRQLVAERLAGIAAELPQGVGVPAITPLLSSTGDLMTVGLSSSKKTLMELRTLADWTVRPHLLAVPGVANIAIYGGEVRQVQIQLQPERLVRYGLSVDDVLAAARKATDIEGAGFIDTPNQRVVLQTEGQMIEPGLLARTVIRAQNGEAVTLGDVARVVDAPAPSISAANIMGRPGVLVKVSIQYGANTLEVTRRVEQALADLQEPLGAQGVALRTDLFRAANFIETATSNIRFSLLLGAVLVVVVLMLFLGRLRTAAISCTAIPLSLLTAVAVIEKFGYSLNTMTMGGLAIAIGEVVDDAVIDVENVLRRLRENSRQPHPQPAFQVVLQASIEVRGAVIFATLAVVLVFLPIMGLSGLSGRMFAPLGAAYIVAILVSLAVALTITPAMCLLLLRPADLREQESPMPRFLHRHYERLLLRVEKHWRRVLGAVVALTLAGLGVFPFLQSSFLPALRENHFLLHMEMAPGTSIEPSFQLGRNVANALLQVPEVRAVSAQVGRAALDDVRGPEASEFDVNLKPGADNVAAEAHINAVLAGFPGASYELNSFLVERVNETLSGYTAPVAVNIFGNDLDVLDAVSPRVSRLLAAIPGVTDLQWQSPPGAPQIVVHLRPRDLLRWGVTSVDVMEAVRTAYEGTTAGQMHEGGETRDVVVILDPAVRNEASSVGRLPVRNGAGQFVPLARLADIYAGSTRYVVQHEAARRVQTITCNVQGRTVDSFVAQARREIAQKLNLPAGVIVEFAGSAAAQAQARGDLLLQGSLAGIGILLLLFIVLAHRNNLLLVLLNLPFAIVGGVLVTLVFGGEVSLGSLVGFVTVFGITLRNSIMLISHYEHLVSVEGETWGLPAALRGARERLVPILMTALVTGLGLLPLALGRNAPGREIEGPMALVILGGLATSTVLNLLVLPTLALRFGRFGKARTDAAEASG
jgi:CzcA family heavy metal efflux pump